MELFKQTFSEARELLAHFSRNENNFSLLKKAGDILVEAIEKGNKIISCGNGGSMSDAMHFAEELSGRFRNDRKPLSAIAIADPAYISCTANDYGWEHVFSRYVEGLGKASDVLLAISTSGNSANVIKACETAKNKGMKIIGLTGKDGGKLASCCDVEIRVPHNGYADRIQEVHIIILHSLIQYIEGKLT